MDDKEPCEHKWQWDEKAQEYRCEWCDMWQFGGPTSKAMRDWNESREDTK